MRPHVACFYRFARAADDIADSPELEAGEKLRRLDGFEAALKNENANCPAYHKAAQMAESLEQTGTSSRHCLDLIAAFRQDAVKSRYKNWAELMTYCRLSAAPVGRYLIDLHGGSKIGYWPSDALCAALQLINYLQDVADDHRSLDRVYLPMDWILESNADLSGFSADSTPQALRQVMDWTLMGVDQLLRDAVSLPGALYSMRLGLEAAVIIQIAKALSKKLAENDPLSQRIELSRLELAACAARGLITGFISRW